MTSTVTLNEAELTEAVRQYLRNKGHVMEKMELGCWTRSPAQFFARCYTRPAARPSTSSHSSLAHQIAMIERPLSPGQVQQDR